ncbi:MAG: flagellar hook-basal body complex protein FliE [Planctomycetota bacterium]|mgnify:CR=1 FL=1|nr:flagellar hook-basal body complex protein FliE [Planctomycetota bacterium]MEE2895206.1 flagellar hook-basal body complex protein FliE [Planctomycetota bacterium]
MSDPLGPLSQLGSQGLGRVQGPKIMPPASDAAQGAGGDFKSALLQQIEQVNQLQQDAEQAKIGAATGEASLEEVITATETADTAFRMLLAVRNKLVDAYDEVKNIRV